MLVRVQRAFAKENVGVTGDGLTMNARRSDR